MKTKANGIDMHHVVDGEGDRPWVVLAHSLACDVEAWEQEARRLSASYRVLRYDARGHGGTDATPGPYSLDLLADDLRGLLAALGIARMLLAGLSMGGMTGQASALKSPDLLESLVLCDTTSRYPDSIRPERQERIRMVREHGMAAIVDRTIDPWVTPRFQAERPGAMRRLKEMVLRTSVDGYVGCTVANMNVDFLDRLGDVRCPALVLVGDQDLPTPIAMAQAMHAAIAGSELIVLPGAPHLSNIEKPEEFNAALARFLESVRPSV